MLARLENMQPRADPEQHRVVPMFGFPGFPLVFQFLREPRARAFGLEPVFGFELQAAA